MPFPLLNCGEQVDLPEVCCRSWYDLANDILKTVVPYMEECIATVPCCGDKMRYFVSMGRPETWQKDFLALYMENLRVDQLSTRALKTMAMPVLLGQFRFLLTEACYPSIVQEGGKVFTPTDEEFHLASLHGYSHMQALIRGLFAYVNANDCKMFALRDVQPTRPEAFTAGWSVGFDFELPN